MQHPEAPATRPRVRTSPWGPRLPSVLPLCLLAASSGSPGYGAGITYHVDGGRGDDRNDGLSAASPLRTLRQGVDSLDRRGGDTLVLSGRFREALDLNGVNGSPGGVTVVRNAEGAEAVIDGGIPVPDGFPFDWRGAQPDPPATTDGAHLYRGIAIANCNYVTVEGIDVRGIAGVGVLTWRSNYVKLLHLSVNGTAQSAMLLLQGRHLDPHTKALEVGHCRINQSNLGMWRDEHNPDPARRGYEMRSETVSVVKWDGFRLHHNHISNSLMEGIDFKVGARNGEVDHNIVEQCRAAGIYANEGFDTRIHHNIVRRIGWYDREDGQGVRLAVPFMKAMLPGSSANDLGATAILISNGDLDGPGRPPLEKGRVSGIDVFANVVYWTRQMGVCVWNRWRREGKTGWVLDDIRVENNTVYKTCQGTNPIIAGIVVDAAATNVSVRNNIVAASGQGGIREWNRPEVAEWRFEETNSISHNLFHSNGWIGWQGENALFADPLFVRVPETVDAPADFRLRDGSPARDAGTGLPKYQATAPDMGAYEHGLDMWEAGVVPERDR